MLKHVNLRVYGRVQGVAFRAYTVKTAERLGLTGFVRNETDGSISIEAEGPEEALDRFVAWCRRGPPTAVVSELVVASDPVQRYEGFEIRFER